MSATASSIISFLQSQAATAPLSQAQVDSLISQLRTQLNELSVAVPGAQPGAVTLLYSGILENDVHSGAVAEALAKANPTLVLTINETSIGKLLDDQNVTFQNALRDALGTVDDPLRDQRYNALIKGTEVVQSNGDKVRLTDSLWDDASKRFAEAASGDVRTITGLGESQKVYSQTEFPALLSNQNVTQIDGIPKSYYQQMLSDGYTMEQVRVTAAQVSIDRTARIEFEVDSQGRLAKNSDAVTYRESSLKPVGSNNFFEGTSVPSTTLPDDINKTTGGNVLSRGIDYIQTTAKADNVVPHINDTTLVDAKNGINQLKIYAALDNAGSLLNKLGVIGDVAGLMLTASQANAAYKNGNVAGGNKILRDWALDTAGGFAGGLAAAQLVGAALSPLYVAGPAGAILAGSLTFIAGLVGGFFGGEALKRLLSGPPDVLENARKFYVDYALTAISPIILDLDGDGVETTKVGSGTYFDHDGNGFAENTGWVGADDGLLVRDLNGNGKIDSGKELFGSETLTPAGYKASNGFEALKALDSNNDGKIDVNDTAFSSLKIWKDSDGNGVSSSSELFTLSELGVKSINLDYTNSTVRDSNGNWHQQLGGYTTVDNVTRAATDVWFKTNNLDTVHSSTVDIPDSIKSLPNIQGYGNLVDLQEAMALDTSGRLKDLVLQFGQASSIASRETLLYTILNVWAGADGFAVNSRGGNIDGKKLYVIEAFMGQGFVQASGGFEGTNGPGPNAAAQLLEVYKSIFEFAYGQLSAQTSLNSLFEKITYSWDSATNNFKGDLSATISLLTNALATDRDSGLDLISEFTRALKGIGRLSSIDTADFQLALAPLGNDVVGLVNTVWGGQVATNASESGLRGTEGSDYIRGLGGDDVITTLGGDDFLDGGTGNDTLIGGTGDDTYIFNKGDGLDVITDYDATTNNDVIRFNIGISTSDVIVVRGTRDLYLNYGNGDRIIIKDWFANINNQIESIKFADQTVWSADSMESRIVVGVSTNDSDVLYGNESDEIINGLAGNDLIFGSAGDDTLNGGIGDDYLEGGIGSDTYLFEVGGGRDIIDDSGDGSSDLDILKILGGVLPSELMVSRDANNIYISLNSNDQITLKNWYSNSASRIERIEFDNGTNWSATTIDSLANIATQNSDYIEGGGGSDNIDGLQGNDQIYGLSGDDTLSGGDGNDSLFGGDGDDSLYGGAGDDVLNGDAGSDLLDGGAGNDELNGGSGDDHYIFRSDSGNDKLNDFSGSNTIHIIDVSYPNIRVSRDIYNNLNLYVDSTGASISLLNWFSSTSFQNSKVIFADSTEWDRNALNLLANTPTSFNDYIDGSNSNDQINGLAGDDEIHGNGGADVLTGGLGNDILIGGAGGDTYIFNIGDGSDTIYETFSDNNSSDIDQISFGPGIGFGDLVVESSGNDLVIKVGSNGDKITVKNWFDSDTYRIEKLVFANGVEVDKATLNNLGTIKYGTSSADTISITSNANHTLYGLEGDDSISGGGGNDNIFGGDGNDSLYGGDGNDLLEGGSGNDFVSGGMGSDILRGGDGDDILAGFTDSVEYSYYDVSSNTFEGGLGNDVMYGAGGADTYIFNVGDGKDTIYESRSWDVANGSDKIQLGVGISTSDVSVTSNGSDLVLKIGTNGDQITIKNWYLGDVFRVDQLSFSDGTLWDKAQLHNMSLGVLGTAGDDYLEAPYGANDTTLNGYAGNDTLVGKDGNDTLNGGEGNDLLKGGGGYDTYNFNLGDGQDVIDDYTASQIQNRIVFGAGISASNVIVSTYGNDLLIKYGSNGDQVLIKGWHEQVYYRSQFDEVKFADGTTWKNAFINNLALTSYGSSGDDQIFLPSVNQNFTVYGYEGNDTLVGSFGNDTIYGGSGNDNINGSAGNDVLYGGDGDDILDGSIGNNELHGDAGNDTLNSGYEGNNILYGGDGNDILNGQGVSNILIGGAGDDQLNGGLGVDTYRFNLGDGSDTILENYQNSTVENQQDSIELGAGISTADVLVSIVNGSDLALKIGANGDQITIKNWFQNDAYRVEFVKFTDGTIWDKSQLQSMARTIYGSDSDDGLYSTPDGSDNTIYGFAGNDYINSGNGNDTLYGGEGNDNIVSGSGNDALYGGDGNDRLDAGSGNDILDGGHGSDELIGGQGSDTYIFNIGDGIDTLNQVGSISTDYDVIQLGEGINTSDVVGSRNNQDLILTIGTSGDQITIKNWYLSDEYQLEELKFANGDIWNKQTLHDFGLVTYGTAGDDLIAGVTGNNTIYGLDGNDTLVGNTGNDTLYGGNGNDTLYGSSGNDALYGGAGNDYMDGGAGSDVLIGGTGNDYLVAGNSEPSEYGVVTNTLEGGAGNDILLGSEVSDTYIFNLGDGADLMLEAQGDINATDRIVFGTGISESDINVTVSGNDVVIKVGNQGDQITILNWYVAEGYQIEQLVFANGTIWDKAAILGALNTQNGTESSDYLYGSSWNDKIYGNGGEDVIYGFYGNDLLDGGADHDEIYGNDGDDTLIGGLGDDRLFGGNGADTYVFRRGDGIDFIHEEGDDGEIDTIKFEGGITPQDLKVYTYASQDLVLYLGNGDSIQISNWFTEERFQIERFEFQDGTVLTKAQLPTPLTTPLVQNGTSGDDLLRAMNIDALNQIYAGNGNDTIQSSWAASYLDGGAGDDTFQLGSGTNTLVGGLGNDTFFDSMASEDTYVFNLGDGIDTIYESSKGSIADQIAFGSGITIADLSFDRVESDLIISVGSSGDQIIAKNWYYGATIETVKFSDGTIYNLVLGSSVADDIYGDSTFGDNFNDLMLGFAGDDILLGGNGNDLLDGGAGNDQMSGGAGNDIYLVDSLNDVVTEAAGSGTDTVKISIASAGATYTLSTNVENATLTNTVAFNLTGNALGNTLIGNSAANILDGGTGADTLIGGDGNDTYVVDNAGDVITETATGGIDTVQSSITYTLGATSNLENLTLTGTTAINGTGNSLDNVLIGNSANNTLTGGAGNDTLDGGAGTDTLIGGDGDDTYIVDSTTDTITETATGGVDTVKSSVTYTLGATSNLENLTLTGTAAINGTGNTLNNVITGNSAANTLNGGAGVDTLIGGDGDDIYVVDTTTDTIIETATGGIDTVQSSVTFTLGSNVENLTLTGTTAINGTGNELDNVITGTSGNNILTGGAGNDTLNGGAGTDTLNGGDGNDIYIVDSTTDTITETATGGIDTVQSSVTFTLGATSNLENLTLTGTTAINGTGNSLDNVLIGNSANNTLSGGAGNDTLDGGAGTDTLIGGDGDDIYIVDSTTDTITETATGGTDTVKSSVTYTLGATSNLENLTLTGTTAINGTGNTLNNVITGNSAANTLNGGAGVDTLIGGDGDDIYVVDTTTDIIVETATGGIDTVQSSVTFTLGSNVENLTLTGTTAINGTGNELDNILTGNSANNTLTGGAGNDTLNGGAGTDTLIGGDGNDIYIVDSTTDIITETATGGIDTVQSSVTFTLGATSNLENLTLTGTTAINGTGNSLDNVLIGNSANNTLSGGAGNDILDGGAGTDTLVGGDGDDTYIVDSTTDTITETATGGTDTVKSSVTYTLGATSNLENLTLTGTTAINGTGNTLNNVITGNSAANTLNGGDGVDTLVGGDGDDIYVVDTTTDTIIETATGGIDTVQTSVTFTLGTNVENLTLTGTTAINGTGNALDNVLTGNSANNTLNGGAGNDTLNGGAGVDTLIGGDGNDTYIVDSTTDIITELVAGGIDTVQSSVTFTLGANLENLTLTGTTAINGTGNELDNVLTGNSANNTLNGGAGNDILNGGAGTDTLIGGDGDDIYIVDSTTDTITETASGGRDTVQSSVTFTLGATSNLENLTLTGTTAINGTGNSLSNFLLGNTANNTLTDTVGGNDILQGLAGGDTINDTSGNNILDGGVGADVITAGNGSDIIIGGKDNDTITTGNGNDVILFNKGDGADTINASVGGDNTLSLGGNFTYSDLSLSKSSNDLILKMGSSDQITFKNWYSTTADNKSIFNLQVIAESMQGFDQNGSDDLRNNKVETFFFAYLVEAFDADGAISNWRLTDERMSQYLSSGSDTEALGGDIAYQYGLNGSLSGIGLSAAQSVIGNSTIGQISQIINDPSSWSGEAIKLS